MTGSVAELENGKSEMGVIKAISRKRDYASSSLSSWKNPSEDGICDFTTKSLHLENFIVLQQKVASSQ